MEQSKPLSRWRFDLNRGTKKTWLAFYQELLGTPASSIPRFYRALNNYGFWPMFEAIVESSERDLTGDPLSYVIAVAKNKWKEVEQQDEQDESYLSDIEAAKERSRKENEELAARLKSLQ
jgi:hypothetical protein